MAWYDRYFERQPRRSIRGLRTSARSTGKNSKRKVWCKMCLEKQASRGADNILLRAEPTSGTGELWDLPRGEGGPMEYRPCNCLTHLRDCALQTSAVRERARAEHVERNLIPRRVPRASDGTREARPAPAHESDHGAGQHATPTQQDLASSPPSEDGLNALLQHVVQPSPYAPAQIMLHDPRHQPLAAPSANEPLTYSLFPSPSSQRCGLCGATRAGAGLPSSSAAANFSLMPVQAPHGLQFHLEQPAIGFGFGAEPQASVQNLGTIFGGTVQSSGLPAGMEGAFEALLTSATFEDLMQELLGFTDGLSPGSESASSPDVDFEIVQMLSESECAGPSFPS